MVSLTRPQHNRNVVLTGGLKASGSCHVVLLPGVGTILQSWVLTLPTGQGQSKELTDGSGQGQSKDLTDGGQDEKSKESSWDSIFI